MNARPDHIEVPFELFFGDLQASPYHGAVRARDGRLTVPTGPGLGIEPDMAVIDHLRLGEPTIIGR
jgi:D-galactarolactone cycloisomerase